MLRYHKFTVGPLLDPRNTATPRTDAEQFTYLYAYSPSHNVKPGVAYPPTLVLTADTDDRVVPGHAKKFFATLKEAHTATTRSCCGSR